MPENYVTTPDMLLFNNEFDPITRSIAFLETSLSDASSSLLEWHEQLAGGQNVERFDFERGSLRELLPALAPIAPGLLSRELLVTTQNERWVAYFAGGMAGADPSPVGNLASRLRCRAVHVESTLPAPPDSLRFPSGSTQFLLLADHKTDWLNHERAVAVGQDGDRWRFGQEGQLQDFETPEAYERRRVRERFTHSMLVDYCAALGLRPFDESFYKVPAVLIRDSQVKSPTNLMSLQEARRYLELDV